MRMIEYVLILVFVFPGLALGDKGSNRTVFELNDGPGRWFRNAAGPVAGAGSLGVGTPGVEVRFKGESNTVHTMTSLLYPAGAANMPFDTDPQKGSAEVELTTPGLYVFFCQIHPYMLGAVVVDDPTTEGLDLGENITLINGITVPTSSDLATRLLRGFFILTEPANWQNFASTEPWHVSYPNVNVRIAGGAVVNLPQVLNARYGNDTELPALLTPSREGVGEVWVDTQFETTADKEKPGTATAVDATTWEVTRKVSLPHIEMNNPHNMWTDRDQNLIYVTEWFDSKLTLFERETGQLIDRITVGEAPAHVMTRVDTDQLHVSLNGSDDQESVVELAPLANGVEREIDIGRPGPHAHWMGHDGMTMVTPNVFTGDSTIYDFWRDEVLEIVPTGTLEAHPIATGMMPDSSKYYVANFLDSTFTLIETQTGEVLKTINLLQNYNPLTGEITGPVGGLPIQTPVSPDGIAMVTANILTDTITIVDTRKDELVASLPCDAGCHGVQFGAKKGGGYYAYISSQAANTLQVVDIDPNGDEDPSDAKVVGRILLTATPETAMDDTITANPGMGGQGLLPIPVVYNGWVQNLPQPWKEQLTPKQRDPLH
ncbi:multicopper oxidase type 1 [Nitrosococcus halophilus Nc 4]|uniref:Multicopper oxidase type 1 n=1 Tax=Nitrosococcus halophilus (strain Nc4) TaxID=472759 RepID=D5BZV8_NITHN|nr:multicopper oxidase [Nitrosococcus halophilus]ADE16205.1 multicopper oxidase type 1 [Nitrosococcus halophilus Nc 4]